MKKKEIGKLIELLNEYEPGNMPITKIEGQGIDLIISKRYGFIEWLVENDKIDREQFYDKARKIITDFDLRGEYEGACNEIIMLLAIQDEPIRFLCEILE